MLTNRIPSPEMTWSLVLTAHQPRVTKRAWSGVALLWGYSSTQGSVVSGLTGPPCTGCGSLGTEQPRSGASHLCRFCAVLRSAPEAPGLGLLHSLLLVVRGYLLGPGPTGDAG